MLWSLGRRRRVLRRGAGRLRSLLMAGNGSERELRYAGKMFGCCETVWLFAVKMFGCCEKLIRVGVGYFWWEVMIKK